MRYAKVDANQGAIVAALRAVGCFVQSLAALGRGVPDLLCGCRGRWFVLEVKDGGKPASKQALTPDEARWHAQATPHAPVHVVASVEQALAVVTQH